MSSEEVVKAVPHVSSWLKRNPGTTFRLIEIDPLLAFQLSIDLVRCKHYSDVLSKPPSEGELYRLALPVTHDTQGLLFEQTLQSILMKTKNLNLSVAFEEAAGCFAGLTFAFSLPLVHVVRYNGRCYLHNGFLRAYAARLAGVTHIPCLFRDVSTPESVGIMADGTTLSLATLESVNPPTVGHFSGGPAYPVVLRAMTRVMRVSWSEHIVADE